MMKKKYLLPLLALPLLMASCNSSLYTPSINYPGIPEHVPGGEGGGGGGGGDLPEEFNMVVNFYLNFSNSDTRIYTMDWYSLVPLKTCPEEAVLTDAMAPDALYPHFIGYSEYPSALDESLLWDFENDYKQSNILNLYGIWVSNS